jgi:excisionase family DNA binding protein
MTLLLTAEEAAKELRIGRTRMYDLMRRGEIVSIKVDGSRRVPYGALTDYVKRLIAEQTNDSERRRYGDPLPAR